jgi:hypothetical protein
MASGGVGDYVGWVEATEVLEISRRLSAALTPADLDETLRKITAAAVEVLPEVTYASITIKHADGRLETVAPTDDVVVQVDAAQYELQEGPCYETAVETTHITAPYLAEDERWPKYGPIAVAAGIEAQAGLRLFEAKASNGALNLYADRPGAFRDLGALGELFTHQAAMALGYARQVHQLQAAVQTRQLIGQAVGLVMERYNMDDARAFGFLARLSQTSNTKLNVVAERLVTDVNGRSR